MAQVRRRRPADGSGTGGQAIFPEPDHDHACCAVGALARAVAVCAERGERLTPLRRRVLESLAASHRPLGAYEIIDQLAALGPRPAPITIYRTRVHRRFDVNRVRFGELNQTAEELLAS